MRERLTSIVKKFDELNNQLMSPGLDSSKIVEINKEIAELSPIVDVAKEYLSTNQELSDLDELLNDADTDDEMKAMAKDEQQELKQKLPEIEQQIKIALLPKDEADSKNAIFEVRAGAGGDEAGLFAAEMFRAMQKYCDNQNWKFEILSVSESGIGSYKEASATITGANVFAKLKYESGVHRVQRVPTTESGGRIHTSTITVAVLPEAEEVDIQIDEKDLRIDVFRASGPGGQSVNTTDSAVRIVHIPTGITVSQQDEKSQHKNRAKAMKVLRARLYEAEREKLANERAGDRKAQVGTGDRSERIRTYNFPQSRVTDHRINHSSSNLNGIMEGEFADLHEVLITEDQARKIASMESTD